MPTELPILYSFRRCPYAIRARMGMAMLGLNCVVREVELRNKPQALIDASAKATVPVLVIPSGEVIDESLDIVRWSVTNSSTSLKVSATDLDDPLVQLNDNQFKYHLDRYKYADRYQHVEGVDHLSECARFLAQLENAMTLSKGIGKECKSSDIQQETYYLRTPELSLLDIAIFPFVRQFYFVDTQKFDALKLPRLSDWLRYNLNNQAFTRIMQKRDFWNEHHPQQPCFLLDK